MTNDAEVAMTEKERFDLYEQLTDWLGPVHAGILMENLPPISWDQIATKHDVYAVKDDINAVRVDFRDAIGLLNAQMDAQGTALRGEMSELRGDLRSEMSELRSDMSDFRTELRTDMSDFRTELHTDMSDFRSEMGDFKTESVGRINQLEERISDKISSAQRQNMALTVAMMLSIWLSIAAF